MDEDPGILCEIVIMSCTAFWSQQRETLGVGEKLRHMDGASLFQVKLGALI